MSRTRQLAAIMLTDMVGYTSLMQIDEELVLKKRKRQKEVLENSITRLNHCQYPVVFLYRKKYLTISGGTSRG